jgi:DNA polymerase III sliding clamp (beta) subunit (PCNA family)
MLDTNEVKSILTRGLVKQGIIQIDYMPDGIKFDHDGTEYLVLVITRNDSMEARKAHEQELTFKELIKRNF